MSLIKVSELNKIEWQRPNSAQALMQDDVQVWRIRVPEASVANEINLNILSDAEKDRASRFVQPDDAQRYIAAHTALRYLLSLQTGIKPLQLAFTKNEFAKPALAPHHNTANIHFNLSHSGRYAIIGLSKHPVGVDVELIKNDFNFRSLLPHYFTIPEAQFITSSPSQIDACFRAWTRKEALGKALGSGITENMAKLPSLDGVHQTTGLVVVNDWKVQTFGVDDGYVASVAVSGNVAEVRFFDFIQ